VSLHEITHSDISVTKIIIVAVIIRYWSNHLCRYLFSVFGVSCGCS